LVARNLERLKDVEDATFNLLEDLKYPVDAHDSVLDMNVINAQHPDVLPALVHHLVKAGWRRVEDKRLIKPRKVQGPGIYEDLVKWVPMTDPDDPIEVNLPPASDMWSVKPTFTETFEERA
jgi:hypothetical protein